LNWVLFGGEDHGFLASFAAGEVPSGFRVIGEVAQGQGVLLDGAELPAKGWDSVSS
jgi:thiamine-monophosphate kinase